MEIQLSNDRPFFQSQDTFLQPRIIALDGDDLQRILGTVFKHDSISDLKRNEIGIELV